jgi:Zn2+/Cd2+-exporting ATPase
MHEHEHCSKCADCSVFPSCGNNEETESENSNLFLFQIIASILFFAFGILSDKVFHSPQIAIALFFAVSIILSGWQVCINGINALIKLRIDESTLMAIAIIAAFCLGQYSEAAIVAILFQLGEMLEDKAVDRSRDNIQKLADLRPDTARRILNGQEEQVSAEEVEIGDTIIVHPFERIPLDGTVLQGTSSLDSSALTGESTPVDVAVGSEVLSGMMNEQGSLTIQVTNDFHNSAASRIIDMVESASARKGHAEKLITRFAEVYTPVVIIMAILLMALPPLFGLGEFKVWLYRSLIFLVASCPCALVISVPLGFYAGIGAASKSGILIKGGKYLEALSKTNAVVFDKTGTLTSGKLSVTKVNLFGSLSRDALLQTAASIEQFSSHPAAKAVLDAAGSFDPLQTIDIEEIAGHGMSGTIGNRKVLCGRKNLLEDNKIDLSGVEPASIYISVDGKLEGSIELSDIPRPDAAEGIKNLIRLNIDRIVMLTGDNPKSAKEAAERCGITEFHAGLLPGEKVSILEKIQAESGTTVFVGDGINDAPVLAASDCGVAMGLGTEAAIEASDIVLTLDKPSKLAPAIRFARRAMGVIRFNIAFALGVKALVLILAALGYAPMWLAVFADVGVCILSVINATRILAFHAD